MENQGEKITFKVEGMSCNHCKQSIERAVRALPGVTSATVDLAQNEVDISFDPQKVKKEELQAAITGAGYRVVG
ncbi:MAG TPA: copper ion binding protein [Bacillota bacterium]|nr:copper ion binding protein [Bacillota bacterium]